MDNSTSLTTLTSTTNTTSRTTASISPTGSALIVVSMDIAVTGDDATAAISSISSTFSISGSWHIERQRTATEDGSTTVVVGIGWAIAAASPGSGTVTVTANRNINRWVVNVSEIPTGYDSTTPISDSNSAVGSATTISATLGTSPGASDQVFGTVGSLNDAGITPGTDFTELFDSNSGGVTSVQGQGQYDNGGAPDGVCDWSNLTATNNACVVVLIAAAGATTTTTTTTTTLPATSNIGFISPTPETISKPSYELWLTDDKGVRIAQLTTFRTLEASRVVNGIGSINLTMPRSFDKNLIRPDRMIQFWRSPRGGRLKLWRVYFVRLWKFATRGADRLIEFGGPDMLDLMRRRIVAAFAGSTQASKTDFADNMMKEIVTESIANGVSPTPDAGTRVWSDLSIAADISAGPTVTKSFPLDKLLTSSNQGVLSVIAKAAKEAGTEVFFDIVPDDITSGSFIFQTYTGQPGADLTDRVVFDEARGNMADAEYEEDWTEEENYVYASGQGEQSDRNIQQVYDSTRYSLSQWNRCEGFADARNQSSDNGVIAAGNDALNAGRPKQRFTATPLDVAGTRFMRDWDFGDKVKARYENIEFNTIIRAVTISVDEDGNESIGARLDYES